MAWVVPLRRPSRAKVEAKTAGKWSGEAFWRNSMLPAAVVLAVLIAGALATLLVAEKFGTPGSASTTWAVVAALISVVGLTKIFIANLLFHVLMRDDARLNSAPVPEPQKPNVRATGRLKKPKPPARIIAFKRPEGASPRR